MRRFFLIAVAMSDIPTSWIVAGVLALLFIIVAVIVMAVVVFLLMRRRSQAQSKSHAGTDRSAASIASAARGGQKPDALKPAPPPSYSPSPAQDKPSSPPIAPHHAMGADRSATVDLSRTMAIVPESDTAPINYGFIRFVSGPLAGQKFDIRQDGAAIGRDATLSQIVIMDPRISKRHVWIGVKDGLVIIADQNSRNGTFLNDPKSPRVTETSLHQGDTVILGESDVARFEYQK